MFSKQNFVYLSDTEDGTVINYALKKDLHH